MSTLLLRLAAPLQSWGAEENFNTRKTLTFPTKSGMVGLLAAALGRTREDSLEDLNALKFGIRVDKEGEVIKDFHMVKGEEKSYITERHYLSDSVFLVGFESKDEAFIKELEAALKSPVFPLFLGRRSCPPTQPLLLGIRDKSLLDCLKSEPWLLKEWQTKQMRDKTQCVLKIIVDDASNTSNTSTLKDKAISFSSQQRQYHRRAIKEYQINILEQK